MDPLSVTASTIAVATLAWQSSKAVYELVDGLIGAPKAVAHSKTLLSETQNTLESLRDMLSPESEAGPVLGSVLQKIKLDVALRSAQGVCDKYGNTIRGLTSHSTDARFSGRDRVAISLQESKINKFNQQLGECQRTISLALISISLQVLLSIMVSL
jgi:Fungal N-terminal domain of STAND proteins